MLLCLFVEDLLPCGIGLLEILGSRHLRLIVALQRI